MNMEHAALIVFPTHPNFGHIFNLAQNQDHSEIGNGKSPSENAAETFNDNDDAEFNVNDVKIGDIVNVDFEEDGEFECEVLKIIKKSKKMKLRVLEDDGEETMPFDSILSIVDDEEEDDSEEEEDDEEEDDEDWVPEVGDVVSFTSDDDEEMEGIIKSIAGKKVKVKCEGIRKQFALPITDISYVEPEED